ncbi:MAG TPA: GNAT family N-acetyltransferase [Candidatus Limnocylindrales bacterium]|nr:GNAT family N-acetyltransferase [Candidatus Limnocylindrales bacterium]
MTPSGTIATRAFDPSRDWSSAAELIATAHLHDGVDWIPTAESLAHDWSPEPGFDLIADAVAVDGRAGRLDGVATVDRRERDGRMISHHVSIWVRPERRRRGLGTAMLEWAEGRCREAGRAWPRPPDWPHVIGGYGMLGVPGHAELAAHHGYRTHRHAYLMLRRVADPVGEHPLPPGLEVRPVDPSQFRAIWDADVEAFQDHPEPATRTEADFEHWFTSPYLDPSLYQVAWDGDRVAGSVLTSINPDENERLGVNRAWLDHVSVRRPYRQRGLAAALIASTIRLLAARGVEEAALGVDAENPSGALRLYEGLGFRRYHEEIGYRKELSL